MSLETSALLTDRGNHQAAVDSPKKEKQAKASGGGRWSVRFPSGAVQVASLDNGNLKITIHVTYSKIIMLTVQSYSVGQADA